MEFPRHLHKDGGRFVVCANADQCGELQTRGWALLPSAHVEQPIEVRLVDALAESVHEAPAEGAEPPRRRGKKIADAVN